MRGNELLNKLELVDPAFVEVADKNTTNKNRRWIKWCAAAACLCLIAAILPIAKILQNKGGHSGDDVEVIAALEYDGFIYEACDIDWVLEKYGLPAEITEDIAGEHLSYLASDGSAGYKESAVETDIELYQYSPSPCRAVYVLRDGKDYMAALFSGFKQSDTNASIELSELYRIYGIDSAEAIASISRADPNNGKTTGNTVTDEEAITQFHTITTSLLSYGKEYFQAQTFGSISEEQQVEAHAAFSDDNTALCIETASGLRFFITVYPSYNWIYGNGTMSYYKMSGDMQIWFTDNIK